MSLVDFGNKLEYLPNKLRLETLDKVRLYDNDFHRNGIESDLDDIDKHLALERQTKHGDLHTMSFPRKCRNDWIVGQESAINMNGALHRQKNKVCVFCKNNGETLSVYGSHTLKDANNRTTCPILRRYVCPKCGATEDNAHTIKYCPVTDLAGSWCHPVLLRTPRMSTGRIRANSLSRVGTDPWQETDRNTN